MSLAAGLSAATRSLSLDKSEAVDLIQTSTSSSKSCRLQHCYLVGYDTGIDKKRHTTVVPQSFSAAPLYHCRRYCKSHKKLVGAFIVNLHVNCRLSLSRGHVSRAFREETIFVDCQYQKCIAAHQDRSALLIFH